MHMDNFLKMDIFFVVATLGVVILTVLSVLVLLRVLSIMKKVDEVTALVRDGGEQLKEDIDVVRAHVHEGGLRIGHLLGLFSGTKKRSTRAKRS